MLCIHVPVNPVLLLGLPYWSIYISCWFIKLLSYLLALFHYCKASVWKCLLNVFQIDRSGKVPMLRFRDRESYAGNKTKEYDDLAMKYLSYVLFFLVACSSVYSLMYERHKSWYSWILSSLTSCVYMFGKTLDSSNCLFCSLLYLLFTSNTITLWCLFHIFFFLSWLTC